MSDWVDFRAVKEAVSMEMVLAHYSIRLKRVNQTSLRGRCPLPTHEGSSSDNSFTVTTSKGTGGAWACQSSSCIKARGGKRGGNALDFVAVMERCSVKDAANKLQEWFQVNSGSTAPAEKPSKTEGKETEEPIQPPPSPAPPEINKPLDFELQGIDLSHPYLESRGITAATSSTFGVGFFPGKGTMAGRVVIPIHNEDGQLIAYAGRSIDGVEPKYKLPAGFHKGQVLYNLHRVGDKHLILVEGFFDCLKVHQAGFPNVVALMGCSLSQAQEELLRSRRDRWNRIVLFLDGDDAGRRGAYEIAERLIRWISVKILLLPENKQPDQMSTPELRDFILPR